jgi:hypothetical protein
MELTLSPVSTRNKNKKIKVDVNPVFTVYTVYVRLTVYTVNTAMADLSLKGLDGDLMVKVKVRALDCGMTLREFVTRLLEEAVDGTGEAKGKRSTKRLLPPEGPLHNTLDRGVRSVAMEVKQQGSVELEIPGQEVIIVRKRDKNSVPASHDPKTCRINKCFMCLAVKERNLLLDSKRGLK